MITITSKKEGFRRCGIAHSREAVAYEDLFFDEERLAILEAEPMLRVERSSAEFLKEEEREKKAEKENEEVEEKPEEKKSSRRRSRSRTAGKEE